MAFVQENNLAGAFVGEVEGGAEAGQAGADDYCAWLWLVVVAWLGEEIKEIPTLIRDARSAMLADHLWSASRAVR